MDPHTHDPKDVSENKDLAALAYVWVLSVVVLMTKRGSPFIKFHARQGVMLFILSLVVWAIPFVGKLAELLVLAMCVLGFLTAAQGEWKELPIVGPLSRGSVKDLRHSWRDLVAACAGLWSRARGSKKSDNVVDVTMKEQPSSQPPPPSQEQPVAQSDPFDTPPPPDSEIPPVPPQP